MHRVVIIGGGFGGLYAAKSLAKEAVSVTLIDKRNFHLFQPLLYQVATGQLSPSDIAQPLRSVFREQRNVTVLLGDAVDLDPRSKVLLLDNGDQIAYDSLIVATGAQNHYFGNDGWERVAPGLKTVEDGVAIRHRLLYAFEAAEREADPERRRAWLTFLVVGGGPTGVELAGALGEIANDVLHGEFRSIDPSEARILLLEGGPRILAHLDPELSRAAEYSLIRLGVRTRTGVKVTDISPEGVRIETADGPQFLEARTVLWGAGVRAANFASVLQERTGCELDRGNRVVVTSECTVPGWPDVFVIGDAANSRIDDRRSVPGVAPAAMQQGRYAARVIGDRIAGRATPPFEYWDKGSLAVIGRAAGVAQFGSRLKFSGAVAWLLWLFVHLMYLVGFQNRLLVFIRWGFSYLTYNRGARLITGEREVASREKLHV